ncbi:MAG: ABC transporter permease [Magnetococcales bacterium]|nr:ABC transporter permease [Magnetococcales bacterium]
MTLQPFIPSRRFLQVWLRNFRVWQKTATASLASTLGEPLLYLVGMGYGLGHYIGSMGDAPYMVFLAAGILAANAMNTATFEVFYGTFTRMVRQNTFQAMLAAPMRVADLVAGEIVWAASKSLFSGLAIFLVASLLGALPGESAFWALPMVFLTGLVFASLGLIMTALSPNYEFFLYYFTLVTTPMALFGGVFYPLDTLPLPLQTLVQELPLTHALAMIRALTMDTPLLHPIYHLSMLIFFVLTGYAIALHLLRKRLLV